MLTNYLSPIVKYNLCFYITLIYIKLIRLSDRQLVNLKMVA